MERIDIRTHNSLARTAAFHGIKIPFKYDDESGLVEFNNDQDELLMQRLKEAQQRKTSEVRARNNG